MQVAALLVQLQASHRAKSARIIRGLPSGGVNLLAKKIAI
jgi:hypothetical protein